MAQKVNPISLRLQQTNRKFDNSWYSSYFYRKLVSRDIYLQQYINSFLKLVKYPSARFSIQYGTKNIKLYTFLCYPKQSRDYISWKLGLKLPKKRRVSRFRLSKRKKTFKLLTNSRLWARVNYPSILDFKKRFILQTKMVKHTKGVKKQENFKKRQNFSVEYKKNFIKYFLILSCLNLEYNRNILNNFQDTPAYSFCKQNQVKKQDNKSSFLLKQHVLKTLSNLSTFQPNSVFYTTLQQNSPFFSLLQKKTSIFSSNKKKPKMLTMDFLQGKKLYHQPNLNFLPYLNKKSKSFCFYSVKTNQLQKIKYKNYIQNFLHSQFNINTEYLPLHVSENWQSAGFLADEIVYFLERRVTFRRLKHKIIKKLMQNPSIRGLRISCSGRVGGKSKKAQRAKTECIKYGQTSRHTFSSKIDFAARTARTIFGSVGIKVWICYK